MSRKRKPIIVGNIDRRTHGYYSTPGFVADYIATEMLRIKPDGVSVLDPAVGKGELVGTFLKVSMTVDGYDIVDYEGRTPIVKFFHQDFLDVVIDDTESLRKRAYDYIILNPPYIDHEHRYISSNKDRIKRHFSVGAFNLYSLFLSASISIAKDGCVIGAIIPDSIFSAVSYDKLRKQILSECDILQLIMCPESLFRSQGANVRSCILILRKGKCGKSKIRILDRTSNVKLFKENLKSRNLKSVTLESLLIQLSDKTKIFAIDIPYEIVSLFSNNMTIGSMFVSGGGISTGNDQIYTSRTPDDTHTIPFYSNITTRFISSPRSYLSQDYIEKSKGNSKFIIRHKEQLDKEGIVCSGVGKRFFAAYMPSSGVSGVNPALWPNKNDINWLLAYLNGSVVTYIMKHIIARGNITTIGNLNALPIPHFTEQVKQKLGKISEAVQNENMNSDEAIEIIDEIIYSSLNLPLQVCDMIRKFCADLPSMV